MALKTLLDTSTAAQFKFEKVGQSLKGYLVASEEFPLNGKMVRKHVFDTPKGLVGVLGSTGLNRGIDSIINAHGLGLWVEATYTGQMKTKQPLPMKTFSFSYDEENRVEVGAKVSASEEIATEEEAIDEASLAPAEEELVEAEAEEDAPPAKSAAPTRVNATPAQVDKAAQSRVQSVLSRRAVR